MSDAANTMKMLFGVAGIYGAFMYYGVLQEGVTKWENDAGERLGRAWFLNTLEALANVIIGAIGLMITGGANMKAISFKKFFLTGGAQVCAKSFTSMAMIYGVSFPVATLAKSAKMVPVMIGSILLVPDTKYSVRKYIQVAMIIGGTVLVNMAKGSKKEAASEGLGLAFLGIALVCDGMVGGLQGGMKASYKELSGGNAIKPYELMTFTNLFMLAIAFAVAMVMGEFLSGMEFVLANPELRLKVMTWALCSAIGQSFIFFTISTFDPLVTTTVTTTRKIFSVLLSIFIQKHKTNELTWAGIGCASLGIIGEMTEKKSHGAKDAKAKK
mmetsp:Transcript_21945/g.50575  ORF Transcript_21945/g.50575 Transcript_21945/m.50575 type:complete len:327 (-) Transcript_21945:186-1166(-)